MIETIEKVSSEALEQVLEDYISWSAGWDRSLPPDVSFGVWADLQQEKKPLEILARFVEG